MSCISDTWHRPTTSSTIRPAIATEQWWRAKGTKIHQARDLFGGHVTEDARRLPSVMNFLRDLFADKPFEAS